VPHHRCADAATLGAVAAYGKDGLEFLTGMGSGNVAAFGPALEVQEALRCWLERPLLLVEPATRLLCFAVRTLQIAAGGRPVGRGKEGT
jgi:hypothetical protein